MFLGATLLWVIANILISLIPDETNPQLDKKFDIKELATKHDYGLEEHSVITEDGYILQLFRLSGSLQRSAKRPPVLLMHGIQLSSYVWVTGGPRRGLAYILADAGYDVWIGNFRGNKYARNHTKLDPDNTEDSTFWDFSFDEMGYYDLPAKIKYIIGNTEYEKIFYIGYSEGATSYLAMAATRPEMKKKIVLSICLAPVAFPKDMKSIYFTYVTEYQTQFQNLAKLFDIYELFPYSQKLVNFSYFMCRNDSLFQELCKLALFLLSGFSEKELDTELLSLIVTDAAGGSIQSFFHYTQMIKSGIFRKYDYGTIGNIERYGHITPPVYNLKNITVPTAIIYSTNDYLSRVIDVEILSKKLPNLVFKYKVTDSKFTHLDFIIGKNVVRKVYNHVLELMSKY